MLRISLLFLAITSCGHTDPVIERWNDHLNMLEIKADKLTQRTSEINAELDDLRAEIDKLILIAEDEEERGER